MLFLLDTAGLLGSGPAYRATGAGPLVEQATFYVVYFAHQHHSVWDIIGRDTILPVAYLTLIIAALAGSVRVRRPRVRARGAGPAVRQAPRLPSLTGSPGLP
ncbi:MAG: hypothetical protein ACRDND_29850 [Streptosporangiaceae bacterium]